ncbi:MAG: hypothetical protein JXX29_08290 [Deltaproteobacteria bacterium]|nr:hypothetical protein [Deltaproteobacteria bacterium]MBN2671659.1 hypothetical protein [Deltaproteobacteria bacterium]
MKIKINVIKSVLLACSATVFFVSCATAAEYAFVSDDILSITAVRPALDEDLATLVPSGLQQASWLNVAEMRTSPLWPTVDALIETHMSDVLPKSIYRQLSKSTSEILAASGHRIPDEPDGFIFLFKGDFKSGPLMAQIQKRLNLKPVDGTPFDTLKLMNIYIFAPTERTIIIATKSLATSCFDIIAGNAASLCDDKLFSKFEKPSFGGVVSLYERGESTLQQKNFQGTPMAQFRWLKDVERFHGTLKLTQSLALEGNATLDEPEQAERVKRDIEGQIRAITSNALIALLGVKPLIQKLKLTTEHTQVSIQWELSNADVKKIVKMIEPLMQIREMLNAD